MVPTAPALAALLAAVVLGATAAPAHAPARVETAAAPRLLLTVQVVGQHRILLRALSGATLRPLRRPPLSVGLYTRAVPSPDGRLVALFRESDIAPPAVRILDVARWRLGPSLRVGDGSLQGAVWTSPTTLLATTREQVIVNEEPCCGRTWLATIDAVSGQVSAPQELAAGLDAAASLPWAGGVVSLTVPVTTRVAQQGPGIAPATLELDVPGSAPRTVLLDRILAGQLADPDGEHGTFVAPGLAVDAASGHAYVASPDDVLADVDLATLQVTYHGLAPAPSLASRIRSALDTPAEAKGFTGRARYVQILPDGVLAVSGEDSTDGGSGSAGVRLVDTRTWSVRTLDPEASEVVADGDVLVTSRIVLRHGSTPPGTALRVYARDGRPLYGATLRFTLPYVWTLGPQLLLSSTRGEGGLHFERAAGPRRRRAPGGRAARLPDRGPSVGSGPRSGLRSVVPAPTLVR